MRLAGARRDPPVNRANVVAGLLAAHFLELDTAAAKVGALAAGQLRQRAPPAPDIELAGGKSQRQQARQIDLRAPRRGRGVQGIHAGYVTGTRRSSSSMTRSL